jgi:hypothetical protein
MGRMPKDSVGFDLRKLSEEVADMRRELRAYIGEMRCLIAELQELQHRFNAEIAFPQRPKGPTERRGRDPIIISLLQ